MRPQRPTAIGIVLLLWLLLGQIGCGYVGDPLPPALYIPLPVTDLSAVQEEGMIVVRFTMPVRSTEDLPLGDNTDVDLRAASWDNPQWDESDWDRRARSLSFEEDKKAGVFRVPADEFVGQRLLLRVRVAGKRDRYSAWSTPYALRVLRAPQAPISVQAQATADGVEVSWDADISGFDPAKPRIEVWRRLEKQQEFLLLGATSASPFVDDTSHYDEKHSYQVRIRADGEDANALSAFSEIVDIIPVDVFAPAPPQDLSAVAGVSSVELSWSRNLEADFVSCRVYRAQADGEFQAMGGPVRSSSFSDSSAPAGETLRYRVTAIDTRGNESAPSETVEVVMP